MRWNFVARAFRPSIRNERELAVFIVLITALCVTMALAVDVTNQLVFFVDWITCLRSWSITAFLALSLAAPISRAIGKAHLELYRAKLRADSLSLTDPLTTLANRKSFDLQLGRVMADAKQKSEPLSLLMTDVDNFKTFNDKYGHLTGDQVLRLVAMSVKQNVKARDIAARYGGEEFMVALPSTPLQHAITIADQIRHAVMTKELMKRSSGERLGRVTISIGVAALRPDDTPQSLLERADACLYAAKRHGRNRVISEGDSAADAKAPFRTRVA